MFLYSQSILSAIFVLIILAGFAIRPLEKKAAPGSFLRYVKWILLGILVFTLQVLLRRILPIYAGGFLLIICIYFVIRYVRIKRGHSLEFTCKTISNFILILFLSAEISYIVLIYVLLLLSHD